MISVNLSTRQLSQPELFENTMQIIEATNDSPEVVLDPENNLFKIAGKSLPENAPAFYKPILSWLHAYSKNSDVDFEFNFDVEYISTASTLNIFKVLLILQKMSKDTSNKIRVKWHYPIDNPDAKDDGERLGDLLDVDFKLVEY